MAAIINKNKNTVNTGPMVPLPKVKMHDGFEYTLVKRTKDVAMYTMVNKKIEEDISVGFEVFRIKISKPVSLMQKSGPKKGTWYHYPESEKLPGKEDFGKTAWFYRTQKMADEKYNELIEG